MVLELLSSRKGRPRMCRACGNLIGANDDECGYCGRKDRVTAGLLTDPLRLFGPVGPMRAFTVLNVAYFALMVLASRLAPGQEGPRISDVGGIGFDEVTFLRFGGHVPSLVRAGEPWRLVTACFIHLGVLHLVFNMMALVRFGAMADDLFGRGKTLAIYVGAGIVGSIVSDVVGNSGAGASGAIFGLVGSFLAYALRAPSRMGEALKAYVWQMILYAILMAFVMHVDNAAHAGGFAGGFVIAYLLGPGEPARKTEERVTLTADWLSIVVVVASFAAVGISIFRG